MSVFIKDMEMPDSCPCYFARRQPKLSAKEPTVYYCTITGETITPFLGEQRGNDCPLVDGKEYEDAFALQAIRLGFWE